MTQPTPPSAEAQAELTVPRRAEVGVGVAEGSAAPAGCKRAALTLSDAGAVRQLAGIATLVMVALMLVAVIVHLIGRCSCSWPIATAARARAGGRC